MRKMTSRDAVVFSPPLRQFGSVIGCLCQSDQWGSWAVTLFFAAKVEGRETSQILNKEGKLSVSDY